MRLSIKPGTQGIRTSWGGSFNHHDLLNTALLSWGGIYPNKAYVSFRDGICWFPPWKLSARRRWTPIILPMWRWNWDPSRCGKFWQQRRCDAVQGGRIPAVDHQLRLVNISLFAGFLCIPGGCLGISEPSTVPWIEWGLFSALCESQIVIQMTNGWLFSLLNDKQMSNKVGMEVATGDVQVVRRSHIYPCMVHLSSTKKITYI